MNTQTQLAITSTVDALTSALKARILDGALEPGERLKEQALSDEYRVARHTLRVALKQLAAEGLVQIEPNKGAKVAQTSNEELLELADLRIALEVEAGYLALERHDGALPTRVHDAAHRLAATCRRKTPAWSAVVDAHDQLHAELVAASNSPRIIRTYATLAAELRLVIMQLKPKWTLERMATDHLELIEDFSPEKLRPHIRESTAALLR
jgi:DNA-binding GntR family transcriptional regulator